MSHMGYKNFREPVVYILNQELRKRNFKNKINTSTNTDTMYSGELPEYPCRLIRNESDKKVAKIIYAENTELEWSEFLIRNSKGEVYRIKTIYPDNTERTIELFKDREEKIFKIDYI